jgi:hypothetical protein
LILRWDAGAHRYRSTFQYWGNYGRRIVDLDHDGLPEFSAFDERFLYEYSAYVFSSAPIRIVQYRRGSFVDVTRKFPAEIRKSAARNLGYYRKGRVLDLALKRGDLGRGKTLLGWPAGQAFVAKLMRDLKKWGYIRAS